MFTVFGAQVRARGVVVVVVHSFSYGLLLRLASGNLDHRIRQTTSFTRH
jgi:hypothetical protein